METDIRGGGASSALNIRTIEDGDKGGEMDRDWTRYAQVRSGRAARPIAHRIAERARTRELTTALDLGCGVGLETDVLLEAGLSVLAIDSNASSLARLKTKEGQNLEIQLGDFSAYSKFPRVDVILACYSLCFEPPSVFDRIWVSLVEALRPGGIIGIETFGSRDSWSRDETMTFLDKRRLQSMTKGLKVDRYEEVIEPGKDSEGNEKVYHRYGVELMKPPSQCEGEDSAGGFAYSFSPCRPSK